LTNTTEIFKYCLKQCI